MPKAHEDLRLCLVRGIAAEQIAQARLLVDLAGSTGLHL